MLYQLSYAPAAGGARVAKAGAVGNGVRGLVIGRAPRYLALFATSASLLTSAGGAGRLPARDWPKDRN